MGIKSVLEVDVDPEGNFKAFKELFGQYQEQLASTHSVWADVSEEQQKSYKAFERIAAALLAQNELARRRKEAEEESNDELRKSSAYWDSMVRGSRTVLNNVLGIGRQLLSWASLGTIFGGLLGAGGLFGLDELANKVAAGRRSALGLGLTYGERQAFDINYSKFVEPNSFLGGVNEALRDVTKRVSLYGAGLSERDLTGKDTAQVGTELLFSLKRLADQTPTGLLGQVLQARGLGQFISLEDFQRLKATPYSEVSAAALQEERDRRNLGVSARDQKVWQDFAIQMRRAGNKIENTFVRGLEPLAPGLSKLSDAVASAIQIFLASPKLKEWMDDLGEGLKHFAGYIASDKFQSDIKTFATDIGLVSDAVVNALKFLGVIPRTKAEIDARNKAHENPPAIDFTHGATGVFQSIKDRYRYNTGRPAFGDRSINNPGNLRPVGATTGYNQYRSTEEGVRGLADDLRYKEMHHHLDTIAKIIPIFAPKNENDVKAYVDDVVKRSGFGAAQHLDLNDPNVMGKLMAAIVRHESPKASKKLSADVIIKILNETGGSAVVQSSQLANNWVQ